MNRGRRLSALPSLLALVLLAPAARAQEAPSPCASPDCCREAGGAELHGRVLTAEAGTSIPGATITFQVTAPPEGGATSTHELRTDGEGAYRICGLPAPARLEARAEKSGATSRSVSFRLDAPRRVELSFEIRGAPTGLDSLQADAAASREASGPGRITGRITDAGTGEPVAEATVTLDPAGRQALTDRRGQFAIPEAPAGQGELAIQHVAYGEQRMEVDVPPEFTLNLDIELPPEAIEVEPIEVKVEATVLDPYLEDRGYYERKRRGDLLGMGEFLDGRDIRIRGAQASHVLSTIPGLRTRNQPYSGYVYFNRYRRTVAGGPCLPAIYLDGRKIVGSMATGGARSQSGDDPYWQRYQRKLGGRFGINGLVSSTELAAVEVYKGAASTAGEFQGSDSRCGVVVLWTKHGPGPRSGANPD